MIVQTQTTSFKAELYEGIHDLIDDTIKIALFNANADLFSQHDGLLNESRSHRHRLHGWG
jgi:hypothetical protein